jgi:outer membrane protein
LKRIQLVEAAKKAIETQLRFTRERGAAGQVPASEVKEIEAQAQVAYSELIDAQNEYRDRLQSLVELTGSPIGRVSPFAQTLPLMLPHPQDIESWVNMAGDGNHELHAQQLAVDAAGYKREEAVGDYLPNVEGTGTYDYTDQGGSQFGGGSVTSDYTLGVRLNVPIFNSEGTGYAFIKESYEVKVESLKLEQLRRKVAREIRDYYNLATGAVRKHKALSEAVAATKVRLAELTEKNRAGQVSSIDVLEAQRDLVRWQRDQFDALVEYILNMTRLKARAGVLSEEDLLYLNRFLG